MFDPTKPMQPASATQTVYNGGLEPLTAAQFAERAAAARSLLTSERMDVLRVELPRTAETLERALGTAERRASKGRMKEAEAALDNLMRTYQAVTSAGGLIRIDAASPG